MARINPDPYAGGHVFALVNRVTGLVDSEEEAMATVRALEEGGVAPGDIDVFIGAAGARCLDLSGREHGRVVRLLRRFEAAVGDERGPKRRIEEGLARGESLVCVRVSYPTGDDKPRAFRILESRHGHEIHYWGPLAFEDVGPSALTCALCNVPAERILGENEHMVWVFVETYAVSPGHSLIIPKRHVESIFDVTPAEREAMLSLLDRAREHVLRRHTPVGYNINIEEGAVGGRRNLHLHLHLIPRYAGDTRHTADLAIS
jgi:diadenosine tetraphosphate (Ap4A) HIT family hydrolase